MVTSAKTWTKEEILHLISTNDHMVGRSLVKLYERQTPGEKASMATHDKNLKGFNGVDAFILTSFAQFYLKYNQLSEKQLALARRKLIKYSKQLADISNS